MKPMNNVPTPHIFIIDDSLTDCLLISHSLRQLGFEVSMATDGREGLRRIMADPPQCLILDIILPGINGYAICRRMRERDPQRRIPIIIVSTKCSDLDRNYAFALGADGYLAKPFTADKLVQTVWDVLPESLRVLGAQVREQTIQQHTVSEVSVRLHVPTLIPYRQNRTDILLNSNPFASNRAMEDERLSWLYDAIDNHSTVHDLAARLQIDLQAALQLLETLWRQQYIAFYDAERRPLTESDFVKLRDTFVS